MTTRRFLVAVLLFLIYAAAVWFGASMLAAPANFFLVVFMLLALGLTVLVVYLLLARMRAPAAVAPPASAGAEAEKPAAPRPAAGDDPEIAALAALIAEANNRLARSPKLASRRLKTTVTRLPLILLGGSEGSGKTSTFLKSGLEPELLAGQVFRDANVVPTRLANLWFAEDALFAELSGGLFSGDAGRWRTLLARLQGRSAGGFLKAIFGGKGQAQLRGFVLFCDMAPFLGVPDPTRLGGLGRRIQERLRAVGESFGTNFPVYVVFTRSDAVPYFAEYFACLVENEDQQILGCTLTAAAPGARPAGEVFAEAETARLADAFNGLYYALADKRLAMLPREMAAPRRPAIYEFPREMKRIRDTLVQFLVDVFRPNPLQPGPILRGFYFTGVRQVTVSALGPVAAEPAARVAAGEATSLFNLAEYQKRIGVPSEPQASTAETTVQRWCFVADLFHRVILADPMGQAVAFASRRHDLYRRVAFGAACLLAFLVCLLWVRSWAGNAGLLGDVETAALAPYGFQPGMRALPSPATLRNMDGLREQLDTLLGYDRHGAPWRIRWGLYAGDRVLPALYDLYFQRFRQVFFEDLHSAIAGTLLRLPPSPDAQNSYNGTYDRLKAYRMITQGKCSADPPFLAPVLAGAWLSDHALDPDRQALATKQIAFYSGELKYKNPYKIDENKDTVERARMYLSSFGGVERLYRGIIDEANKTPRNPARLADLAPNYKQVLNSPGEVQAAFTRDGFNFVQDAIKDPSRLTMGEPCVLGVTNVGAQLLQGAQVQTDLQNLYIQDYIRRWKDFTSGTGVQPFRNAADASKKLELLADNRSPLLAAVFLIADNTNFPPSGGAAPAAAASGLVQRLMPAGAKKAVDLAQQAAPAPAASPADISKVFQPSQQVVVVTDRDRLINDPNRAYMNALADLQRAMQRLQDDRPSNPDMSLHDQARKATEAGLDSVRQVADKFNIANSQGVDAELKRMLESPFRESLKFIITDPAKAGRQGAGAAVQRFCTRLAPLQRKFPFNPASDTDAGTDEVAGIFSPQAGAFADLAQQLSRIVVKQGRQWTSNPASQDVHPSPDLLGFLNKMQQIQDALFPEGSPQMRMRYGLKPVPEQNVEAITLNVEGHQYTASRNNAQPQTFTWPGSGQVVVSVRAGGNIPFGSYSGPWAVLRWMYDADPRPAGTKTAQWSMLRQGHGQPQQPTDAQGRPIVLRVEITEFPAGVDLFDRNFFNVRCPSRAAE